VARNPLEAELVQLWRRLLGVDAVSPTDSFVALGGHSLLAARVIHEIAEIFGRKLPLSMMFPDTSPERLALAVRASDQQRLSEAVAILNPHGSRALIIYFHGDYGGAGLYVNRLARLLGPDQPIAVIHPHGVDGPRVPPTIEAMALDRLTVAQRLAQDRPVLLGGFCNGGLVAYETARILSRAGHEVLGVLLVDAAITTRRYRLLAKLTGRFGEMRGHTVEQVRNSFLKWRDRQATIEHILGFAADSTHRFDGVGDRLNFIAAAIGRKLGEWRSRRLNAALSKRRSVESRDAAGAEEDQMWITYLNAIAAYAPEPYVGPVRLLVSDALNRQQVQEEWQAVAPQVEVQAVPGRHLTCVTEELPRIADAMKELLRRPRSAPPPLHSVEFFRRHVVRSGGY
jgi:thioesterase domain-containing protein